MINLNYRAFHIMKEDVRWCACEAAVVAGGRPMIMANSSLEAVLLDETSYSGDMDRTCLKLITKQNICDA